MYHIGMIQYVILPDRKGVISADETVQAVVRMWDNNLLILLVDKKIGKRVKSGDYVLSDYTPMSPTSKHRKLYITKILPKNEGSKIWKEFEKEYTRRKVAIQQQYSTPPVRYIR